MNRWIAAALFALLLIPTVASAQSSNRDRDRDRGNNGNRGRGRPVFTLPARPVTRPVTRPVAPPVTPRPVSPIPEPSAALVFLVGLATAGYAGRRRA